jgi:hypothetical protein
MRTDGTWRTSTYTGNGGNTCVEVRPRPEGVDIRDTKDRPGGTLSVSPEAWAAFIGGIKAGNFQ